jgi:hypothetical protein
MSGYIGGEIRDSSGNIIREGSWGVKSPYKDIINILAENFRSVIEDGIVSPTNFDATKITSGIIDISHIPQAAIERVVPVADQTARFALTINEVQAGDTVKQIDTSIMYVVVNTDNLGNESGYVQYSAGLAAAVPWSGVQNKPTTLSGYGISTSDTMFDSKYALSGYGIGIYNNASVTKALSDTTLKTGLFYYSSSDANKPDSSDGAFLYLAYSATWINQIAYSYSGKTFTRTLKNGVWTGWNQQPYITNSSMDIVGAISCTQGITIANSNNSNATLGTELATNGDFTSNITGWSGANWAWESGTDGQARHTAGSTSPLTQNITLPKSGYAYQINFTMTGRTSGGVTIDIAGNYISNGGSNNSFTRSGKSKQQTD